MNTPILHHYPASPYAEKIRLILGAKRIAWKSVEVSWTLPRPELGALTGGYRRIPVLQIGADIYCDTALIASVLDALAPQPALYPANRVAGRSVAELAERELFAAAVGYVFQPKGFAALFAGMNKAAIDAFLEDRKQMRQGAAPRMELPEAEGLLQRWLVRVTEHLADGRQFLVSDAPTIADFSVYHPLWFVQRAPVLSTVFEPYPEVCAWMARMAALGHGSSEPMSSAQALAVAASASPVALPSQTWVDHHGCRSGDAVSVMPTDYGIVPVRGDLIGATPERFTLRRHDEQAGELHVHFPRAGYRLMKL